ncbi:C40 family peptidase [Metabacillus sp. GX 13764]|uniref:C40 family peptidase n=1 Tax=Metabacillus kandeliae TaxID=2900151 RepID=UPI001E3695B3|nr:C40 family peptidase [Metabacillus kandeliae]MCD7035927.1 C40 family peptidase [Metabacillus kandeliae]
MTKWRIALIALMAAALFFPEARFEQAKAASASAGQVVMNEAVKYKGTSYSSGGNTPASGFNSAGFVQYIMKKAASISLPGISSEQYGFGQAVAKDSLQPGDVLFFKDTATGKTSTAGFYAGNGEMIYSSVSEGVTTVNVEKSAYWSNRYLGAKRITENPSLAKDNPVVSAAIEQLGVPYIEGGKTPAGFDCSGFTQYVYRKAMGIYLPSAPEQQWETGEPVKSEDIRIGDLVFFQNTHRPGISHVGIYAGENQILNATRIGGANKVTVSYLSNSFLQEKYAGIRRVSGLKMDTSNPIVKEAASLIGTKQHTGGITPAEGFDTGGFVQYAVKHATGISLPRYGKSQMNMGTYVSEKDLKPGDLVFFQGSTIVPSIYAGNGQVILVSNTDGVSVVNYKSNFYWKDRYVKAKRL